MKTLLAISAVLAVAAAPAFADPGDHDYDRHQDRHHEYNRDHDQGRYRGVIERGHDRHAIVYERRAPDVIVHDRYARQWHHGFRARHNWREYHPAGGWLGLMGIETFSVVSSVTCEAANEQTGELYPVTAQGTRDWSDAQVNSVLDQALEQCAAAAGANVCVPAQPPCSYR